MFSLSLTHSLIPTLTHIYTHTQKITPKRIRSEHLMTVPRFKKEHLCPICGQMFQKKMALFRHLADHPDYQPHKCVLCASTFRKEFQLKIHMENHLDVDSGWANVICKICREAFSKYVTFLQVNFEIGRNDFFCFYTHWDSI